MNVEQLREYCLLRNPWLSRGLSFYMEVAMALNRTAMPRVAAWGSADDVDCMVKLVSPQ